MSASIPLPRNVAPDTGSEVHVMRRREGCWEVAIYRVRDDRLDFRFQTSSEKRAVIYARRLAAVLAQGRKTSVEIHTDKQDGEPVILLNGPGTRKTLFVSIPAYGIPVVNLGRFARIEEEA